MELKKMVKGYTRKEINKMAKGIDYILKQEQETTKSVEKDTSWEGVKMLSQLLGQKILILKVEHGVDKYPYAYLTINNEKYKTTSKYILQKLPRVENFINAMKEPAPVFLEKKENEDLGYEYHNIQLLWDELFFKGTTTYKKHKEKI